MLLRIFPRRRRSSALKPLDAVFTELPMNDLLEHPLCRVCSVAPALACLCVMLGIGRSAAAPVTLSIPGTITVTTEFAGGDGGPRGRGSRLSIRSGTQVLLVSGNRAPRHESYICTRGFDRAGDR